MNSPQSDVSSDVSIVNLREQPQWLRQVVEWHQGEWPHQSLQRRQQKLQLHLTADAVPTTLLALDHQGKGVQLLGTASLVRYQRLGGLSTSYWLANVFVVPERRRQGLATDLIQAVEQYASRHAIKELHLYATDRVAFYQQRGWQSLREKTVRGQVATIMRRQLR